LQYLLQPRLQAGGDIGRMQSGHQAEIGFIVDWLGHVWHSDFW
jgi:hypothetical protein